MTELFAKPVPLVLAAPSGAGKTSIARALVRDYPAYGFSVSVTTRRPRDGERDGIDYQFVDEERFEHMAASGELVEWARVHGHGYGTTVRELERCRASGLTPVLDIDVQGALQVKSRYPEALLVFVLPPTGDEMIRRLRGRATENAKEIHRRLTTAISELEQVEQFDCVVVNTVLGDAVEAVHAVVLSDARRPQRIEGLADRLGALRETIQAELPA